MKYLNPPLKYYYFRFQKTNGRLVKILLDFDLLIVIGMSFFIGLPNFMPIEPPTTEL